MNGLSPVPKILHTTYNSCFTLSYKTVRFGCPIILPTPPRSLASTAASWTSMSRGHQDLQLTDRWTRGKRSKSGKNVGLICSFMNWGFPEIPAILISNLCWQCNVQWIIYLFLRLDIVFYINQWCFLRRQNLFQSGFSLIGWMEHRGVALGRFLETFVEMHVETSPFTWVFHRLM